MNLVCRSCQHEYDGSVFKDDMGWYGVCPKCGASFPVDLPEALFVMTFADDSDPNKDWERFVDDFTDATALRTYYTFDSVDEFAKAWNEQIKDPDGMWYFVLYKGKQIMSGACDPGDADYFAEDIEGWPEDA